MVTCSAIAYSFSLETLVGGWRYQTPLADLALVPFLAALLLVAAYRRHPHVVDLRLARIDVILAVVLHFVALALLVAGPVIWSKYFWATRLDLLTLPLFVAAAVMLLFGTRALIRFGFALTFLLLVWPLPYHALIERTLGFFTAITTWAATTLAGPLGLAQPDPATEGLFMVEHNGEQFSVLVGSACSGVNTLVGFLVVGVFGLYFVRGAASRRLLWLVVGAALVWSFNVVRILGILAVGKSYGERAAFEVLHPVAGLLALNAAALVLVLLMRPFGLRWRRAVEVDSPLAEPGEPQERATPTRFLRRLRCSRSPPWSSHWRTARCGTRHADSRTTVDRRWRRSPPVRSSAPAGKPSRWRRSAGRPPITASTPPGSATGCGRGARTARHSRSGSTPCGALISAR